MESNFREYLKNGLQGTRPTALQISKGSHTISKSSSIRPILQSRKPVIIYIRSPEVIHTNPRDFMALVQRLTGSSPTRSRCQQAIIKTDAAIEGLHPPALTDRSQSFVNCSFDEYVDEISAFLQDDDQMGMGSAIVNLSAKLEEDLSGGLPPNMACLSVEDPHMSSPNLYSESQPGDVAPGSANNEMLLISSQDECHAVQDYALNMYDCGHDLDSLGNFSGSSAPGFDMANIRDPLNSFTSLLHECPLLDPEDFSIPIPFSLELLDNVFEYQF